MERAVTFGPAKILHLAQNPLFRNEDEYKTHAHSKETVGMPNPVTFQKFITSRFDF